MRKFNYYWLLSIIPLLFIIWFFVTKNENKPLRTLPYFGPKNFSGKSDTSYHKISAFSFTNQFGKTFTNNEVKNKIYVTEFFFTTCKTICPIMNNNLEKVYATFKADTNFLILSHTVDPEIDSVSVLKAYADFRKVTTTNWQFVTGSKKELYKMARKAYLLDNTKGTGDDEDFVHTQNFALIDKEGHIRGFYDGTIATEIDKLILEINLLKQEYEFKNK